MISRKTPWLSGELAMRWITKYGAVSSSHLPLIDEYVGSGEGRRAK